MLYLKILWLPWVEGLDDWFAGLEKSVTFGAH